MHRVICHAPSETFNFCCAPPYERSVGADLLRKPNPLIGIQLVTERIHSFFHPPEGNSFIESLTQLDEFLAGLAEEGCRRCFLLFGGRGGLRVFVTPRVSAA